MVQDAETYPALVERPREREALAALRARLAPAVSGDLRPAGLTPHP